MQPKRNIQASSLKSRDLSLSIGERSQKVMFLKEKEKVTYREYDEVSYSGWVYDKIIRKGEIAKISYQLDKAWFIFRLHFMCQFRTYFAAR